MRAAPCAPPRPATCPAPRGTRLSRRDAPGFLRPDRRRYADVGRGGRARSCLPQAEDKIDAVGHTRVARHLALEVARARRRQLIDADLSVSRRHAPLRLDESFLEEPLERGIERSLFHLQKMLGRLLDALDERVPVHRLVAQEAKHHHFECAGEEITRGVIWHGTATSGEWSRHTATLIYSRPRAN